jgi:hypothetical protein
MFYAGQQFLQGVATIRVLEIIMSWICLYVIEVSW